MEDQESDKFLAEMESKLKLQEDEDQVLGHEMSNEEKIKLAAAQLDEEFLRGKDGTVNHVEEIDFIINDVLKH